MQYDNLMFLSAMLFVVLFLFLSLVNSIIFVSLFKKKQYCEFQPKVSVVIPAYNEEKNIEQCLASVISSHYPNDKYELIVVDDGSTDNTAQIVKDFSKIHIVKLLRGRHKGKSEALNLGIKKSSFDFVLTIDADTILDGDCIKNIVLPFSENDVGAVAGMTKVRNKNSVLGMFQNVEFSYNNLVRFAFSNLFGNTIWFHGACACYRKKNLLAAGLLTIDTLAEDLDVSLQMYKQNVRTMSVSNACAYTTLPNSITGFIKQRVRWSAGVLQCLKKHRELFEKKSSFSVNFIFINQWWWSIFAVLSLPSFILQILYWMPWNSSFFEIVMYFFRWFTLSGPVYVLYKLPDWGFSVYNFFGVMSGIITAIFIILALKLFGEKLLFNNAIALFFYFPYTILLNISIVLSILKYKFYKSSFFIR